MTDYYLLYVYLVRQLATMIVHSTKQNDRQHPYIVDVPCNNSYILTLCIPPVRISVYLYMYSDVKETIGLE